MTDPNVPTDEEFLEALYRPPEKLRTLLGPSSEVIEERAELLLRHGLVPEGVDPQTFVREMDQPTNFYRKRAEFTGIRREVRRYLREDEEHLLAAPIGYLQTELLNAMTVRTPRGGHVVVMDSGISLHLIFLARCMHALITYGSPKPFCRDHDAVAFIETVRFLAFYSHTNNDEYLAQITTWNCPSLPKPDLVSANWAGTGEIAILLHELGHAALGHLESAPIVEQNGLETYSPDHTMEFRADEFALERMLGGPNPGLAYTVVGMILRFFDYRDHLVYGQATDTDTHPAGRKRWDALRSRFDVPADGHEHVRRMDWMFDYMVGLEHGAM